MEKNPLENENLLKNIFGYLDFPQDGCRASLVCRSWREAASDAKFWKDIDVHRQQVASEVLCAILRRHHQVQNLNARRVELTTDQLALVLPALSNLQRLELEKSSYASEDLALISQNIPQLTHLVLAGGVYSNTQNPVQAVVHPIPYNGNMLPRLMHPNLRSLVIQDTAAPNLTISCHNLRSLRLDNFTGNRICVRGCPQLQELHVFRSPRSAESLARCLFGIQGGHDGRNNQYINIRNNTDGNPMQMLQTLVLQSSLCITDSILEACSTRFPQLTRLELNGCQTVVGSGLSGGGDAAAAAAALAGNAWQSLAELRIIDCDTLTGSLLSSALRGMFSLTCLYLEGCTALTNLSIDSRSLREVKFRYPDHLSNLDLNTVNLDTFEMHYDTNEMKASAVALRDLSINSASLARLSLARCPLLNNIQLACTYLHELELIECDALYSTESHLSALQNSGDLPELQKVSFHACHMLSGITINSPQVRQVIISACRGLSNLTLKCDTMSTLELLECTNLVNIDVSSRLMKALSLSCCPHLQKAMLRGLPNLETLDLRGCNGLGIISLECLALRIVDASLCSSLNDDAIAALARCAKIEELQIGPCNAVTVDGIVKFAVLKLLRNLDLSYMPLQDPTPLFNAVCGATKLRLTNNFAMEPTALCSMIQNLFNTSDILREVDVSHSNIGPEAAADLVVNCRLPLSLAVNGIRGAPGGGGSDGGGRRDHQLWPKLHSTSAESVSCEVRALSMVQSRGLDAFYLGLVPKNLALEHGLCGVAVYNKIWTCADTPFLHVSTPLTKLEELNLGVGEFHKVAIALPNLCSLQLNCCAKLKEVTLHCPRLTRLSLSACKSMNAEAILTAIKGCPMLQHIDIRLCHGVKDINALCARIKQQLRGTVPVSFLKIAISTPTKAMPIEDSTYAAQYD